MCVEVRGAGSTGGVALSEPDGLRGRPRHHLVCSSKHRGSRGGWQPELPCRPTPCRSAVPPDPVASEAKPRGAEAKAGFQGEVARPSGQRRVVVVVTVAGHSGRAGQGAVAAGNPLDQRCSQGQERHRISIQIEFWKPNVQDSWQLDRKVARPRPRPRPRPPSSPIGCGLRSRAMAQD